MRNPNFYKFFVSLTLLVFTGCATATFQPPKFEGNRYTNYEYIYTVEIPEGWRTQKELKKKLLLSNDKTNGTISIAVERGDSDWYGFSRLGRTQNYVVFDRICKRLKDPYDAATGVTVLASQCYSSSFELTHLNWKQSTGLYKPEKLLEVTYKMESSAHRYDGHEEIFLYPCQDQKTCYLVLSLNSKVGNLDKDKVAFKDIVGSLRVHDYTQQHVLQGDSIGNDKQIILFEDTFTDNRHGWTEENTEEFSLNVINGQYVFEHKRNRGFWAVWKGIDFNQYHDFSIEATIKKVAGVEGDYRYGIIWGVKDANNFHHFGVFCNGNYSYGKCEPGEWHSTRGHSTYIDTENCANKLTILKEGKRIKFFINNNYVDETDFESFFPSNIGFIVENAQKIEIDYLRVKQSR